MSGFARADHLFLSREKFVHEGCYRRVERFASPETHTVTMRNLSRFGCRGLTFAGAILLSALPAVLPACMGVGENGRFIAFGDQTNIVLWNPDTQTEHFARNAVFRSDARDFGFIAPTPSRPELSEVSSEAFVTLAELAPQEPRGKVMAMGGRAMADEAGTKSVVVVQEADVAGYHATTLLAGDAGALAEWMRTNGYATTPAVEAWTNTYIAKGWFLTALKVSNRRGIASTGTVRMSFQTDRPFNPFYVPGDNIRPNETGTLKVYFVSNDSYSASIGSGEPWDNCQWAAPVPQQSVARLARQLSLPVSAFPDRMRVEEFEDRNFPRPAS